MGSGWLRAIPAACGCIFVAMVSQIQHLSPQNLHAQTASPRVQSPHHDLRGLNSATQPVAARSKYFTCIGEVIEHRRESSGMREWTLVEMFRSSAFRDVDATAYELSIIALFRKCCDARAASMYSFE